MQINIAPCGLICSRCDAFRATQENDPEKLERVAAYWRELNHCDEIQAEFLHCDGCMNEGGRKSYFCEHMCEIRKCAIQHSVSVCSECADYPCKTLNGFLDGAPEKQREPMKKLLNAIAEAEKTARTIL